MACNRLNHDLHIGDTVTVIAAICEEHGKQAQIIDIDDDPGNDMPYTVRFYHNFREWPFSAEEIERRDLMKE